MMPKVKQPKRKPGWRSLCDVGISIANKQKNFISNTMKYWQCSFQCKTIRTNGLCLRQRIHDETNSLSRGFRHRLYLVFRLLSPVSRLYRPERLPQSPRE